MRNKTGLQWCGFAFVSIVGTLWHFIYRWTGNNRLVALVCPVNESPWEHLKLLWFPFLLWCLINLRSTKEKAHKPQVFSYSWQSVRCLCYLLFTRRKSPGS